MLAIIIHVPRTGNADSGILSIKKALSAVHSAEGALLKTLLILGNIEIVFPDLDILERIFAAGSVIEEKAADDGPVRVGEDERIRSVE